MHLLKRLACFFLLFVLLIAFVGLCAFGLIIITAITSPVVVAIIILICAFVAWEQSDPEQTDS